MNALGKLLVVVLVCSIAVGVSAEPINYGDYNATTVQFLDVEESGLVTTPPQTPPVPLFGSPTAAGNSLLFNPVSFSAHTEGLDSEIVDGTLATQIVAKPNYGITGIEIIESGDYNLFGNGTAGTYANVSLSGSLVLSVLKPNNQTVLNVVPFGENFLSVNLANGSPQSGFWSGQLSIDFASLVLNFPNTPIGEDDIVTQVSFNIDNTLNVGSELGTIAHVAKKQFQLRVFTEETVTVPEPSTLVMLGLGTLALCLFRRKTK